jgi:DNA-binding NtrC family response regulator
MVEEILGPHLADGRMALLGSEFSALTSTKKGLLQQRGNVLIEHINTASLALQEEVAAAFLSGSFVRPGGIRKLCVTCRAIYTLEQPPQRYYEKGSLAPPLFRVLAPVRTVVIPPLRERPGDVAAIARQVLGRDLTPDLERALLLDPWPGNATELKAHLLMIRPFTGRGGPPERCLHEVRKILHRLDEGGHISMRESLTWLESEIVAYALHCTEGHKTRAAELLGMSLPALRRHIGRNGSSSS